MSDELARWASEICPGHPIDLGIVRAVKLLRDAGFHTFEACEGGGDHAYAEPTVRFEGSKECGRRALKLLADHDLPIQRLSRTWSYYELIHRFPENPAGGVDRLSPFWEVTFASKLA